MYGFFFILNILEFQNVTVDTDDKYIFLDCCLLYSLWPSLYHSRIIHIYVDEQYLFNIPL